MTLISRTVEMPNDPKPQEFHSIRPADYVTILAVTRDGRIPLVRQYRPVLERETLELPGGLHDSGNDPMQSAIVELEEEVGFHPGPVVHKLGNLSPDTGRLENRLWCYFAPEAEPMGGDWRPEPGTERVILTKEELRQLIVSDQFDTVMHLGIIGLAMMKGLFRF
jgi:ADP-ribose pyrophosphatase